MLTCRTLAVDPELTGLSALARLLRIADATRAPSNELIRYAALVERIGDASAELGLLGFLDLCGLFSEALRSLNQTGGLSADALEGLQGWMPLAQKYASQPGDEATSVALVAHLRLPCWCIPMSDEDAENLADMLCTVPLTEQQPMQVDAALDDLEALSDSTDLDDDPVAADNVDVDDVDRMMSEDAVLEQLDAPTLNSAVELSADSVIEPMEMTAVAATESSVDPATMTAGTRELLSVLIDELPQVSIAIDELVGLACTSPLESGVFQNALETASDMLTRLGSAAESLGLTGLNRVCESLRANLDPAAADTRERIEVGCDIWHAVVPAICEYLKSPYEPAWAGALITLLTDTHLAVPIDGVAADALVHILVHPEFPAIDDEMPARPQVADVADVSLELPDDVNPELVDALLHELPQQTEELSAAVQRMRNGGSLEDVNIAQRIAHTIKGAGNTVGVRGLAELTHQLEDILLSLAKNETLPTPDLWHTLVVASDCLQGMAETLQGTAPAPTDSVSVLQQVLDWANRIDREGPPTAETAVAPAAPHMSSAQPSDAAGGPSAQAPERDTAVATLRVPTSLIDDLMRLVGEAMIQNSQLHERARSTRQEARTMIGQFDLLQQIGTELEELIDLKDLSSGGQRGATNRAFDSLELDQYNELHTHSRRLIEAAVDAREIGRSVVENLGELNDMLVTQERLNRDTQEGVLRTRMVPVKTVFPRLERSVRQTCRLTGKHVEFHVAGGETQMDSDVLGRIVDPLMHVLRNAVDHGIEDPPVREAAGKHATGHITLEFLRDGNNILARCRDDGGGLDLAAIRTVAEERGLLAPGSDVAEEVLRHFILLPNFTTRGKATQTSGRGIGLDVVQTSIAGLGGSLTLHSTQGQGCVIEIRLPVSLLSSNALLVRTSQSVVAIASRGVEQIRHIEDGEVRKFGTELLFQTGDQLIPASSLDSVLELPPQEEQANDYRSVLIVRSDRGVHAVLVRSVMASRDVVIKTLGRYVPRLRGIVGATILGDGSVTPVLDLSEMLRVPVTVAMDGTNTLSLTATQKVRPRRALVVDDSLSARRSMEQVLSDSGFEVSTARDGMDAVEVLERTRPDILFVDMEMPRMNGIELTSHVRSRAQTANLPIVMITSRSTEKHRAQARSAGVNVYLTKPFDADALLQEAERLMGVA